MAYKKATLNLISLNLTLSQNLTQAHEKILLIYKQLHTLQVQTKTKTPATKIIALDQKTKNAKLKCYCWTHGKTYILEHTSATCNLPNTGHHVGAEFGDNMRGSEKWCKEDKDHE